VAKAGFVRRAEGICERNRLEILRDGGAYVESRRGSGTPEAKLNVEMIHTVLLPKLEAQTEEIRALGAPAGDDERVEAFLSEMEGAIEASKQSINTAASLRRFGAEFAKANELASEYGLAGCAFSL